MSRARRDDGRRSPWLRASELLFGVFAADGAVDGDARAEACDGLPSRLLAKLYWTVKSNRDGVREREQLQLATLGANPHCHSNFSFLDGASHPEELAEQAARMGIDTLALTDHDGLHGVVRFAEAAKQVGVRTAFGAELSLETCPARRSASRTRPAPTC